MKKLVSFILFNILPAFILAQFPELEFDHIKAEHGLSSSVVKQIRQDSKGFLWIGTDNGLNRFDGYDFVVYRYDEYDSTSISNDIIGQVFIDYLDNVWLGCWGGGLCRYDRNNDNFIRYPHNPDDSTSMPSDLISPLYEDRNNDLWIGTYAGAVKYIREKDEFLTYSHDPDDSTTIGSNTISGFYEDDENNFWICTWHGGLNLFDRETGKFTRYMHNPDDSTTISHNFAQFVQKDKKGNYWVGTWGGNLNAYNPQTGRFNKINKHPDNPDMLSEILTSVYEDRNGYLWFGTTSEGLTIFNPQTLNYNKYPNDATNIKSLSHQWVNQIFKDKTGIIWITTNNGLNKVKYKTANFQNHIYNPEKKEYSLSHPVVYDAYEDNNGLVWIGTQHGGLNLYNPKTGKYTTFFSGEDKRLGTIQEIQCVQKGLGDVLWLGTAISEVGIIKFNTKSKTAIQYNELPGVLESEIDNVVSSMYFDSSENILWLGFSSTKLVKFNPETEKFNKILFDPDDYGAGQIFDITSIAKGPKGNIWAGIRQKGLFKYNVTSGDITKFKVEKDNPNSISNVSVLTIIKAKNDILWIGTQNGLNRFDSEKNLFKHYFVEDGLPTNQIENIVEDGKGNIWIGSEYGITKFNPETEIFTNFDKDYGIEAKQLMQGSYYAPKSGNMYINGNNGFVSFKPDMIPIDTNKAQIVFTSLEIHKQAVTIGEEVLGKVILEKSIAETKELFLTYKHNNFSLTFAGLHYKAPHKNRYKYTLEGYDKEWHYLGTERTAGYMNLDPKDYVFKVKAANADGFWNEEGASIIIHISPPWYQTWTFRIILIVVIVGSAFAFYYIRMSQIKKQKELLEKKVVERTTELKEANYELQEQKEEILTQNEEIQQQAEELQAQRDALEEQNVEIQKKSEQVQKSYDNMKVLSEFGQKVTTNLSTKAISNMIYEYVDTLMDTSAFGIGLYLEKINAIEYPIFIEEGNKIPYFKVPLNKPNSMAVWCFTNSKEIYINNYLEEYKNYIPRKGNFKTSRIPLSVIYLPLISEDKTIGIITVQSFNENAYSQNELNILRTLASYISIALLNASAYSEIKIKNKKIESSIQYAKTIQNSILPSKSTMDKYISSFVIFKPKDVVSGDFYWFYPVSKENEKNILFAAAVDCTGHGVPGAFMSLIGSRLLNEIVGERKIYNPAQILEFLNVGIQVSLNQDQSDNNDGMDVCLCKIETTENNQVKITYSGAKRPLYYYNREKNRIDKILGDRKSIGGIRSKRSKVFYTNKEAVLNIGDIVYLTSDGYIDQNSPDRKRFGTYALLRLLSEIGTQNLDNQKEILEKALKEHMEEEEQRDDITFLGVKLNTT